MIKDLTHKKTPSKTITIQNVDILMRNKPLISVKFVFCGHNHLAFTGVIKQEMLNNMSCYSNSLQQVTLKDFTYILLMYDKRLALSPLIYKSKKIPENKFKCPSVLKMHFIHLNFVPL